LNILKIPYLSISNLSHLKGNNNFIFNLSELTYIYNLYYDQKKLDKFIDMNFDGKIIDIKEILKRNPEVLIIDNSERNNNTMYKYVNKKNNLDRFFLKKFNLNKTDFNSIKEERDIIIFNGSKYKLDSCLLRNYNRKNALNSNHVIAGITCNNNKYVYNGWNKLTSDQGFNATDTNLSPCSLMKFDWDIHKNNEFCLNTKLCKLDAITDPDDLCFNFGKTEHRILVYVKMDELKNDDDQELYSFESVSDISEKEELIENFYNIDKISFDDILQLLIKFNTINTSMIDNNNYLKIKLVLLGFFESFDFDFDNLINIKKIFSIYQQDVNINYSDKYKIYTLYYKKFYNITKPSIIINDTSKLLSEIKNLFPDYDIPLYYSINDLNQILFDLYKIRANIELIIHYFISNPDNKFFVNNLTINYLLHALRLIITYFPNKIKLIEQKKFREIAKFFLNKTYNIKDEIKKDEIDKDKIIANLKIKLAECEKSKDDKLKLKSPNEPKKDIKITKPEIKLAECEKSKDDKLKLKSPNEPKKDVKITKPEIIANIKKLNPKIKGLTSKTKNELIDIYEQLKT